MSRFAETVRAIVLEAAQPELVAAVEEVNQALSPERRVQLFVNETPTGGDRNATAVALVREHALDRRQKALVIFGSGHVWRRFGGVTKLLEQQIPGRVLVVETIAPVRPSRSIPPDAASRFAASTGCVGRYLPRPAVAGAGFARWLCGWKARRGSVLHGPGDARLANHAQRSRRCGCLLRSPMRVFFGALPGRALLHCYMRTVSAAGG